MGSLVSMKNIIPLLLQILTLAFIQIASLYYLYRQKWFTPIPDDHVEAVIVSWENTVLFSVSCYQYIILATVYSKGKPYREMLITNSMFLLSAVSLTVFITWMMVYPCVAIAEAMQLMIVSKDDHDKLVFRSTLVVFPAVHFLLAFMIEVKYCYV